MTKKILWGIAAAALMTACTNDIANSNDDAILVPGNSLAACLKWLAENALSNGNYKIVLAADEADITPITLDISSLNSAQEVVITLYSAFSSNKKIALSHNSKGSLFTIGNTITLILSKCVTLQGHNNNSQGLVCVNDGGIFEMKNGSKITGNKTTNPQALYPMGAGVYVNSGGTFNMSGGEIAGNQSAEMGGGVAVKGDSEKNSIFNMSGGIVSDNAAIGGGGVLVYNGGIFNMSGGTIARNIAGIRTIGGGGVSVYQDDTGRYGIFKKTGGLIYGYLAGQNESNKVYDGTPLREGHAICVLTDDVRPKHYRDNNVTETDKLTVDIDGNVTGPWDR